MNIFTFLKSHIDGIERNLQMYPTRPMFQYLKNNYQHPLVGVEIGVWAGSNAINILSTMNIKLLYLIDPYELYDDGSDKGTKKDAMMRLCLDIRALTV